MYLSRHYCLFSGVITTLHFMYGSERINNVYDTEVLKTKAFFTDLILNIKRLK